MIRIKGNIHSKFQEYCEFWHKPYNMTYNLNYIEIVRLVEGGGLPCLYDTWSEGEFIFLNTLLLNQTEQVVITSEVPPEVKMSIVNVEKKHKNGNILITRHYF